MGYQSLGEVRQHDSHHSLVGAPAGLGSASTPMPLDAIVVPASRTASNLEHAFGLAHAAGCKLVAICSHEVTAFEVQRMAASLSFDSLIAIDLPKDHSNPLLHFETSNWLSRELPEAFTYQSNLSAKRNIGLLLAHMLGWTRIFYLDDDIRNIERSDLRRTIDMLDDRHTIAGLQVMRFPDNSIVCHAHRATGGRLQDVFVSGSALGVNVMHAPGFFPDIYNEDWLFFYPEAAERRLGLSDCHATQLRYDPFASRQRAAWQEFGDVLAEGIYGLLHDGRDLAYATSDYWQMFLRARADFLDAILKRAEESAIPVKPGLVECIDAARKILTLITPEMCEKYVSLWRADLKTWSERVASVAGTATSVDVAVQQLGLPTAWPAVDSTLPMRAVGRYDPPDGTATRRRPLAVLQFAMNLLLTIGRD
jgi:hypothetical protein